MLKLKKRKDGRYQLPVKLPNGKYKYLYARTESELKEKYNILCRQLLMGNISEQKMTVSEWLDIWYRQKENEGTSDSRLTVYDCAIRLYIKPTIGSMQLADVKQLHIDNIISVMHDKSKAYQQEVVKVLKQAYEYAVANDVVNKNPCKNIKFSGTDTKEKEPLTLEQQKELLEKTSTERSKLFVALALFAGLRRGEILSLKWSDITENVIKVKASTVFKNNQPTNKGTKSKAGTRDIPIPKPLQDIFDTVENKKGFVIKNSNGEQCSQQSYKILWESVENKVDYHVKPHILRHTYITNLFNAGVDAKTAQYLAGHANISTTLKIYTHLSNKNTNDATDKLTAYFNSQANK